MDECWISSVWATSGLSSKQHLQSTIDRAGASLREFELVGVCFRSSAGLAKKAKRNRSFFGHIKKTESCILATESLRQNAYNSEWNLESSASLQQNYRQSRVHLSL
jgi:hypothetical protein